METLAKSYSSSRLRRKGILSNVISLPDAFRTTRSDPENVLGNTSKKFINIFIVDDDPLFLKALELSISSRLSKVKIQCFETGEACLQHIKAKPDIVVLDYYLNTEVPYAWNGVDILKQIRKLSQKTKVIVLSSQDSLNVAIECMNNGAYDYVSKTNSGLTRINKIISNITSDKELNGTSFRHFHLVVFLVVVITVLYFLLNR